MKEFWVKNNLEVYQESKRKYEERKKEADEKEKQENPFYGRKDFFLIEFKQCQGCGAGFVDRSRNLNVQLCRCCKDEEKKRISYENARIKNLKESITEDRSRACKSCGVLFSPLYGFGRELRSTCSDECHDLFVLGSKREQRSRGKHVARVLQIRSQRLHGESARFKRVEIYERDRWVCKLCGKKVNKELPTSHPMGATLDHIVPVSQGGLHIKENVQLAHRMCNSRKGNRSIKHEQLLLVG
jgi:5-methylcytosine-specific restriction endonuclease McrA